MTSPGPLEPSRPVRRRRTPPPVRRDGRRRPRAWRFRIGQVLGTSATIWFANFLPFTLLAAIVFAPYVVLNYWAYEVHPDVLLEPWWFLVDFAVPHVLGYVVSATVIYGVFQKLRGRDASFSTAVSAGLGRLPAVIGVAILILLCYAALWLPAIVAMVVEPALGGLLWIPIMVLTVIVACALFVAVPVCVVERPGVGASLARSWRLTRGFRLPIVVLLIVLGILNWIVILVLGGLTSAALGEEWFWGAAVLAAVLVTALEAVVSAVAYHDLRTAVEGIDTEELASIFD